MAKSLAKQSPVPRFVRVANVLTTTLLRAGIKLNGFGHPMYLLTVRGRKSGQPRTTPVAIVEQGGNRYLFAPYGVVDWVRNLRSAGAAIVTRGRRAEEVRATVLPSSEAGSVLKSLIATGTPLNRFFGVSMDASDEEYERTAIGHPVFLLQHAAAPLDGATRPARDAQ